MKNAQIDIPLSPAQPEVEARLSPTLDRVAGRPPSPSMSVYDALGSGAIQPEADRPRFRGRDHGIDVVDLSKSIANDGRAPLAYQKPRQQGSTLALVKGAVENALRDAYREQLSRSEAPVVSRLHLDPRYVTHVDEDLAKSARDASIDRGAVVDGAAARLQDAARHSPGLRAALSRLGVSRRTLAETYDALALTPLQVTAGF